jgi:hypothetical protein
MFAWAISTGVFFVQCHPANKDQYLAAFEKAKTEREEMYNNMEKVYDEFGIQFGEFSKNPALKHQPPVYDRFTDNCEESAKLYLERAYANLEAMDNE